MATIIPASRLDPSQERRWLVEPYIPAGEVTLLSGARRSAKGLLCAYLAAFASRGQRVPWDLATEQDLQPHSVYWVTPESSEDRLEEIRDRFAGANGEEDALRFARISPSEGVAGLRPALSATPGEKIVIIDPIQAVVGDLGRASARESLEALVALARETSSSVVAIIHLTKNGLVRGRGEIQDVVRSHLWIGAHPSEDNLKVLMQAPSSYGEGEPVPFVVDGSQEPAVLAHYANGEWDDDIDIADLVPKPPKRRATGRRRTARERAKDFLTETLGGGPVAVSEIERRARRRKIARSTLHRAAREHGIVATRQAREASGTFGPVLWALPWDTVDAPQGRMNGGSQRGEPHSTSASSSSDPLPAVLWSAREETEVAPNLRQERFGSLDLRDDRHLDDEDDGPGLGTERFRGIDLN